MQSPDIFITDYPQLPNWAGALLLTGAALMGDFDFQPHEILIPSLEFDEIYVPRGITQQTAFVGGTGRQTEKMIYSPGDVGFRSCRRRVSPFDMTQRECSSIFVYINRNHVYTKKPSVTLDRWRGRVHSRSSKQASWFHGGDSGRQHTHQPLRGAPKHHIQQSR